MTPWTVACQAPLSMGFSQQEYWSGLSFLSPGVLPDSRIEPGSPALQTDSLPSGPLGSPGTRVPVIKSQRGQGMAIKQTSDHVYWTKAGAEFYGTKTKM